MINPYEVSIGGGRSLEVFVKAAKHYGVEGLEYHREGDNEVLEQKVGEGWPGMGHEGENLWMGLAPEAGVANQKWNANTKLKPGQTYRGIVTGAEGMIAKDHPLAQLFKDWHQGQSGSEFYLTGEHADWQRDDRTRLRVDQEGNLRGNIPVGKEIKAVITGVPAKWGDGKWIPGAKQRLEIIKPLAPKRV